MHHIYLKWEQNDYLYYCRVNQQKQVCLSKAKNLQLHSVNYETLHYVQGDKTELS